MSDQSLGKPKYDKALKDEVALLSYVDDLIRDRTDMNYKKEDLPSIKALLMKEVQEAINRHLISILAEKDQIELDDLLQKKPSDDELNAFFMKKIPNLDVEIAVALLQFRAAYLYPTQQKIQNSESRIQNQRSNAHNPSSNIKDLRSNVPPPAPIAPVTHNPVSSFQHQTSNMPPPLPPAPAVIPSNRKWN